MKKIGELEKAFDEYVENVIDWGGKDPIDWDLEDKIKKLIAQIKEEIRSLELNKSLGEIIKEANEKLEKHSKYIREFKSEQN